MLLHQAKRGDFGPVADPESEARERLDEFYRDVPTIFERITANGSVLQICRRAMPDGGVVTLYSDITERKEAEAKMEPRPACRPSWPTAPRATSWPI